MSLLAEIYLSKDEDAANYDKAPDQFIDRAQYKNLTPLELSTLWAIMQSREWEPDMMGRFPCLLQLDGGARLIHKVPVAMVSELAALSPDKIGAITSAWAATDELRCNPAD